MKNILSIDANTRTCTLLSNLDNGENSIVLDIKADVSKNPILQIMAYNIEITSADFEYTIPESMYIGSVVLRFRIADDDGHGPAFAIHPVESVSGNLYLKYVSDRVYQITCVKDGRQRIIDMIYPVGSIYISVNETSPSALFGGTWEQIKDRFLLSAGDTYSAGATGGEATHKLTTGELPAHNHSINSHTHTASTASSGSHSHSASTSENGAHTHKANRWKGAASGTARYAAQYSSSSGENDLAMSTNGAHTHTVTVQSNGSHTHTVTVNGSGTLTSNNTGSGNAHNNMPPYLAVYVWKRTA